MKAASLLTVPLLLHPALAQSPPGEGPALGDDRVTQQEIESGTMSLFEIRKAGLKMFSTPFNKLDGYGDGPMNPFQTTEPGGRPTLQGNGTFLRVNGLDAQTCMECHSIGSFAQVPFRFAVGGAGGSNNNAIFQPTEIDVSDLGGHGYAAFNGRFINPPFLFGSGGVELLGKEMTADLQDLLLAAAAAPDTDVHLLTHGVSFGILRYDSSSSSYDYSGVEGIDEDLVVRPFGRKGEFPTVRAFDVEALRFHMGMEPIEAVGAGVDNDQDGVVDEILTGELSALHIFNTNLERPEKVVNNPFGDARGAYFFDAIGCTECHVPHLDTVGVELGYAFPEVPTKPSDNVFMTVDLSTSPAGFDLAPAGGLRVPMFSDLKRHAMGPGLAEAFGSPLDDQFITARLWGVADTAPYMHDGRSTTLTEAILAHGGEAQAARDGFEALPARGRKLVLEYLRSLKTPVDPADDLF